VAIEKGGWGILSSDILERATVRGLAGVISEIARIIREKVG
jgi:hypothetical protein